MMLSTCRIISAASAALSSTCLFTWKLSVTPRATMSPTVPWVMSETQGSGVRGQTHSGLMCVCVCVRVSYPGHRCSCCPGERLSAETPALRCRTHVISDDGGQLRHKHTPDTQTERLIAHIVQLQDRKQDLRKITEHLHHTVFT